MRVVMYDKVSEDLSVYNAESCSIQDGFVIVGLKHGTGYFPVKRFVFCGFDEYGLLCHDMTAEHVRELINAHNKSIDDYINNVLPGELEQLGHKATNGRICGLSSWFDAQYLIKEQRFEGKAMKILNTVRAQGFDVKIDKQAYKLVWYGGMIND